MNVMTLNIMEPGEAPGPGGTKASDCPIKPKQDQHQIDDYYESTNMFT